MQVFGEKLVRTPLMMNSVGGGEGRGGSDEKSGKGLSIMTNGKEMEIEESSSPEQLKGSSRILLKVSLF